MKTRLTLGILGLLLAATSVGCGSGTTEIPSDAGTDGPAFIDGGGDAAVPPNGAAACPQGVCNYQTNSGCAATQTCVFVVDANGTPVPTCTTAGTGLSGAPCTSLDQCAPGYICANTQCRKLCCGGDWTGCPGPGEHCILNVAAKGPGGAVVGTGAMLCQPINTCDALDPASCPVAGETCQIVDLTGVTACFKEGTGDSGEACPCKGGFLCVDDECRRLCKAVEGGGEPTCEPDEGVCVHYVRDPPGVGECTPQTGGN